MARVTNGSFAERLLRSAEQAVAIEAGELEPAKVGRRKITAREATVTEPPVYTSNSIAAVRKKVGASRPVFARMLGVSAVTVGAWEQGQKSPSGPTRRLLEVADKHPEVLAGFVRVR